MGIKEFVLQQRQGKAIVTKSTKFFIKNKIYQKSNFNKD